MKGQYDEKFYTKYLIPYRKTHKSEISDYEKNRRKKLHTAILYFLGGQCVICNRTSNRTSLIVHQLRGKNHPMTLDYIVAHKEDFVLLCRPHHAMLHRLKNEGKLYVMIALCEALCGFAFEHPFLMKRIKKEFL